MLRHLRHLIYCRFQEEDSQVIRVILGRFSAASLPLLNRVLRYLFPIYGNLSLKLVSLQASWHAKYAQALANSSYNGGAVCYVVYNYILCDASKIITWAVSQRWPRVDEKVFEMAVTSPQNTDIVAGPEVCWRSCNPPLCSEVGVQLDGKDLQILWTCGSSCVIRTVCQWVGMPKEEMGLDPGSQLNLSLFSSSNYSVKWTVVSPPGSRVPLLS